MLDPFCPVFKVGYIIDKSESDENEKLQMLLKVNFFKKIDKII